MPQIDLGKVVGEPGLGLPSGGSAGDVLVKQSSTDYETAWSDEVLHPVVSKSFTIPANGWTVTSPYYYTWLDASVTASSEVSAEYATSASAGATPYLSYEKVTGGVKFTANALPTEAISVTVRVYRAKASLVEELDATDVETSAITGAANVEEALDVLEGRIGDNKADIGTLSNLTTTAKSSLVAAANELNSKTNHKTRYIENTSKTDVTLLSEDFANIPANDVTFYRINPTGAYMMGSFIKYNSQSGSGVFTTYAGKTFQISNNAGTWSKEELALKSNITNKLNCVDKTTGSGKTFTITFDGYGAGHNAYIFGRFGYDSTKLSSAIVSHGASGSASIKCFGDETATVSCSGDVVTVTTQNNYAAVTVISSKTIS